MVEARFSFQIIKDVKRGEEKDPKIVATDSTPEDNVIPDLIEWTTSLPTLQQKMKATYIEHNKTSRQIFFRCGIVSEAFAELVISEDFSQEYITSYNTVNIVTSDLLKLFNKYADDFTADGPLQINIYVWSMTELNKGIEKKFMKGYFTDEEYIMIQKISKKASGPESNREEEVVSKYSDTNKTSKSPNPKAVSGYSAVSQQDLKEYVKKADFGSDYLQVTIPAALYNDVISLVYSHLSKEATQAFHLPESTEDS